ncbi:hypothetical protein P280DRAFT_79797 [Massarina eburnea CBS 473.64]|uniref:Uncharacterized protein n=1 Tax=Massarina eburnea CBS 473.64 TaxID=1395130 RepID=A0A6A6RU67_9PLEO|nr:hypothetical protein P280DRAFT_79797 [Massarina eburnea CBS 473.64]
MCLKSLRSLPAGIHVLYNNSYSLLSLLFVSPLSITFLYHDYTSPVVLWTFKGTIKLSSHNTTIAEEHSTFNKLYSFRFGIE